MEHINIKIKSEEVLDKISPEWKMSYRSPEYKIRTYHLAGKDITYDLEHLYKSWDSVPDRVYMKNSSGGLATWIPKDYIMQGVSKEVEDVLIINQGYAKEIK